MEGVYRQRRGVAKTNKKKYIIVCEAKKLRYHLRKDRDNLKIKISFDFFFVKKKKIYIYIFVI